MKCITVFTLLFLFTLDAQIQKTITHSEAFPHADRKQGVTVSVNPAVSHPHQVASPDISDKKLQNMKRIVRQKEQITKFIKTQKHAIQPPTQSVATTQESYNLKPLLFHGKKTFLYEYPFPSQKNRTRPGNQAMVTNVLLNGKNADTIYFGDSFVLSFTFAPNTISARVNITVDVNRNGITDSLDYRLVEGLTIDNSDDDENQTLGELKITIPKNAFYSSFIGTLIFEVDDGTPGAPAFLTVRQQERKSILKITTVPAFRNVIFAINGIEPEYLYALSDSLGKATLFVNRSLTPEVVIYPIDLHGITNGFSPPNEIYFNIKSDTTTAAIKYDSTYSFIKGIVTDNQGIGIGGCYVEATGEYDVGSFTDSSGQYSIGVKSGYWYLNISNPDPETYLTKNNWNYFFVPQKSTIKQNITLLKANSKISGSVMLGTAPLTGFVIRARSGYDDYGQNNTLSNSSGIFTLPVFKSDTVDNIYSIELFLPQGYVTPSPFRYGIKPGTSDVNFILSKINGGLQGVVKDSRTGVPIPNASINFMGANPGDTIGTSYYSTQSNDTGFYRIRLKDARYTIYCNAAGYAYYSQENVVVSGVMVTKDILLQRTGSFSGTVLDPYGKPVPYAYVNVMHSDGYQIGGATTDEQTGKFLVYGLSTGKYKAFVNYHGYGKNYVQQWYNKKSTIDSADWIQVQDGYITYGINFFLEYGGSISGRVTDLKGNGLPDIEVIVFDTLFSSSTWTTTDDSGFYFASGLATGTYLVHTNSSRYVDRWYNGKTSFETADRIPVIIHQETKNINFTLPKAVLISGSVKNKSGDPIEYAEVIVTDSVMNYIAYSSTDDAGSFALMKLPHHQSLFLKASSWNYSSRWYKDSKSFQTADPIILSEEETRSDIDFILPAPGTVSGVVRTKKGDPVPYAYVYGRLADSVEYGSFYGYGNDSGQYIAENVQEGKYIVYTSSYPYKTQWYKGKSNENEADTVIVIEETNTDSINFYLTSPGLIKGRVTDSAGVPLSQAIVFIYDTTSRYVQSTVVYADGYYQMHQEREGVYFIKAMAPNYFPQWFNQKKRRGEADTIVVKDDSVITDISFLLHTKVNRIFKVPEEYSNILEATMDVVYGDTILVNSGVYRESIDIPEGVWLIGAGFDKTIIDGNWKGDYNGDVVVARDNAAVIGVTIRNATTETKKSGIGLKGFTNNIFRNNWISHCQRGIVVITGATISKNILVYNSQSGILASGFPDVIANNTIMKCGVGIMLGGESTRIVNNIIGNNNVGVSFGGRGYSIILYNNIFGNSINYSGILDQTGFNGNISIDPLFVKSDSGNYHLSEQSPCIDAGDPLSPLDPDSSRADIGALYFHHAPNSVPFWKNISNIPDRFELYQNFPNPFNPVTTIVYALPKVSNVKLTIYNMLGQEIRTLVDEEQSAGWKNIQWNAVHFASGIYFYKITADSFVDVKKLLLLK